ANGCRPSTAKPRAASAAAGERSSGGSSCSWNETKSRARCSASQRVRRSTFTTIGSFRSTPRPGAVPAAWASRAGSSRGVARVDVGHAGEETWAGAEILDVAIGAQEGVDLALRGVEAADRFVHPVVGGRRAVGERGGGGIHVVEDERRAVEG